jgi:hypothetical protein
MFWDDFCFGQSFIGVIGINEFRKDSIAIIFHDNDLNLIITLILPFGFEFDLVSFLIGFIDFHDKFLRVYERVGSPYYTYKGIN